MSVANACTTPISAQGSTSDATRHPPTFLSCVISQLFSRVGGGGGGRHPSQFGWIHVIRVCILQLSHEV